MLATLRKRFDREDEGFTLIELMVVVLIIAILLAIAIPTFLGARERAQDRAAQSDLRNALTAEKVFYTDNQTYTTNLTTIKSIEPSLTYTTSATANKDDVGVFSGQTDSVLCVQKKSAATDTFSIIDISSGARAGTYFAKSTCPALTTAPAATGAPYTGYKTGGW